MGKRNTILLLVLFFGGLGGLWWARRAGVPTASEREAMAGRVLPGLLKVDTGEIARIEVEGPAGGDRVALERRGPGHWQVVEPIDALADGRRVEILLNNLKELRRSPEAGVVSGDPSRFGLDPPARVLRLYRDGDRAPIAALALGDELERLRYVKPDGGPVALADAPRVAPNDVDPASWRERGLFDIYSYDVRAINVVGPGRRLNVVLDEGRWRIVHPFRAPANAEAINGLLADLAELEAVAGPEGFVAEGVEDLSPFGLDPPRAMITLLPAGLTGSTEQQIAYLGASPEGRDDVLYARREGQDDVLLVRARGVADVGRDAQAVRSRKVVDFRPAEVAAIRIEADGRDHRLLKGGDGWRVVSPGEGPADALDMASLLETISGLESAEFFGVDEVDDPGLDAPKATVSVWLDQADDPRRDPGGGGDAGAAGPPFERPADVALAIGRYDAGRKLAFGRLEGDEVTVLALPETVLRLVPEGPLAFRDRTLVRRQDPRAIRRVELTRDGRDLVLERPEGGETPGPSPAWQVVEPTSGPADQLATLMLVEALARLRAERWVEAEVDAGRLPALGLDEPTGRVSWVAEPGDPTRRTLLLGAPAAGRPDERLAMLEGEPGAFTVGPKLLTLLAAEFRERRLLAFPVDEATGVVVRGPGGSSAFDRDESAGWRPEEGDWPAGYGPGVVESLVAGLSELTADRIVQDDGPMPEGSGLEPPSLVVEVRLRDADRVATVRLGAAVGGLRFAATGAEGPGPVFLVKADPFALPPPGGAAELPEEPFAP